jgi:hypothetical protein
LIIVGGVAKTVGIDWVAAGLRWQAERMTIRLIPVSAERIPAWLERSRARREIGGLSSSILRER